MQDTLKDMETRMQAAVDLLTREFAGVRTGRANVALLEPIRVEAYGTVQPIAQLATPSAPDPKTLVIQVWDTSLIPAVEKAILKSDLGLTPANDGKVIRLSIPSLTEERRKQLAKTVGKLAEDARVAVRNVRREANDRLKGLAKDKKASQDEERRGHEQIQKTTDRFIGRIDELAKKKEQEILSI
jgi:ribosome recycling factor